MICAAVTLSAIEDVKDRLERGNSEYEDSDKYESAAGWLVFVSVMGMVYEPLVALLRFLNLEILNQPLFLMIFSCVVSSSIVWE